MPGSDSAWLLLVLSLPTQSASARMRIWRALKALGCAALRDGAYLLPASATHQAALQELAEQCAAEGGSAWVLDAGAPQVQGAQGAASFEHLFDRSADHAEMAQALRHAAAELDGLSPPELSRLRRKLARDWDALRAIDFFPNGSSVAAEVEWSAFAARLDRLLAPGEPQGGADSITPLDPARYRGRVWATRKHLWVDRVASAWLIRRFIDPEARFKWLADPADCPKRALGFDFDGAAFSHVGARVTFETLLASFALEADAALLRLGSLVHALDVGGLNVPEASGFEATLSGARERLQDDDRLLSEMSLVLDSLYTHFQREQARPRKGGRKP